MAILRVTETTTYELDVDTVDVLTDDDAHGLVDSHNVNDEKNTIITREIALDGKPHSSRTVHTD